MKYAAPGAVKFVTTLAVIEQSNIMQSPTFSSERSALHKDLRALGDVIRARRILLRRSRVDLAASAGISRFLLARVEAGKPIRTDSLSRILLGLGLAIEVREIPYDELPIFSASQLRITPPRTPEDIRRAMSEGRFAEMTPHQAGYDDDEK